jgi:hypothetical protein
MKRGIVISIIACVLLAAVASAQNWDVVERQIEAISKLEHCYEFATRLCEGEMEELVKAGDPQAIAITQRDREQYKRMVEMFRDTDKHRPEFQGQ